MMRCLLFIFTLLLPAGPLLAQPGALTLDQAMEIAVENNLSVQQQLNNLEVSEIQHIQRKFDFLPGVNASGSFNRAFGRSVDNFTQQIAESPITFTPSIGASLTLFQGFAKWNNLKNAANSLAADQYSLKDLKNDIRMNVALAFFQVIFATDNLALSVERLELLERQLERAEKQFAAGAITQGDVYSIKSQVATETVNKVQQTNALERARLDLLLSLNLDPQDNYDIQRPDVELMATALEIPAFEEVYGYASLNNPGIREKQLRILAQRHALNSARADFFPSVSLSYGAGTFYSSNARPIIGADTTPFGTPQPIYGDQFPLFEQLNDNFGHSISLSINIPIFNRLSTRQRFTNSRVAFNNAELALEIEEQDLYRAIQQAYQDARAAQASFAATQEQLVALTESYHYATQKFEAGLMDFYSYLEILNNKNRADRERIQAKYDLVLKIKILELYQGKDLRF